MAQINLLPWREQERKRLKVQFFTLFGLSIGLTLVIAIFIHFIYAQLFSKQQARNNYLQAQINLSIAEANNLEEKKKTTLQTLHQLHFLIGLQYANYDAVIVLNELAKLTPPSITFTYLDKNGPVIILEGSAQSNTDVTQFIKDLAKSKIFKQPVLTKMTANTKESSIKKDFQIKVEQKEFKLEHP